nr:hypothetical protein [uncultured Acetatifactor sp.]
MAGYTESFGRLWRVLEYLRWNTDEEYPVSQSELLNYPALEFKDGGTYPRRSKREGTEGKSPRRLRGSITGTHFSTRNSTR